MTLRSDPSDSSTLPPSAPERLPDRWWVGTSRTVARRIAAVRWTMATPYARHGEDLDRLLHHHPSLVRTALEQGLAPRVAWRRHPDLPVRTALWHALERGSADAVLALIEHRSALDAHEQSLTGTLPLAVVHLGRNPPPDSPLYALSEDERTARENALLSAFVRPGAPWLGETDEEVAHLAARLRLPDTTMRALLAHGLNLNHETAGRPPASLGALMSEGDAHDLDRWFALGWDPVPRTAIVPYLPLDPVVHADPDHPQHRQAQADSVALHLFVVVNRRSRPGEARQDRLDRMTALLRTLQHHGWTPGPGFQACAMATCTANGQDPALLPVVRALGADPNGRDQRGRCALHGPMVPESLPCVPMLLALGADPQALGPDGQTPIDVIRAAAAPFPDHAPAYAQAVQTLEDAVLRAALDDRPGPEGPEPWSMPSRDRPRL